MEGLAWLWDTHLPQRVQGQDEHGGHEDEGLNGTRGWQLFAVVDVQPLDHE